MRTISIGQTGRNVVILQEALKRELEVDIAVDGDFGKGTRLAVMTFQKKHGLVADGVVGERTQIALGLKEDDEGVPSWALKESDLVSAAKTLKCELNAIKAVSKVESGGGGFYKDGRPKILYERHLFHRYAKKAGLSVLADIFFQTCPDLCNTSTGGYKGGLSEYPRLNKAMKVNPELAIMSCSWGRYQILGSHAKTLGYKDAFEFKAKMEIDEGEHLKAFVLFIRNDDRLLKAIRSKDWTTFARIYNGPGYKNHKVPYDVQMETAYNEL